MKTPFYDTHCHIDYPDFAQDVDGIVARAESAGITKMVAIGTDLESSARAVALASRYPAVYAAVGWHPGDAMEAPEDIRTALRDLARQPKVVALGETGLDFYRLPSKKGGDRAADEPIVQKQMRLFAQHLEVAAELGLNCVVHQRDCFDEALAMAAQAAGAVRCVFHCFVNGPQDMERVVAIGGWVSFTGIITFKTADAARASLAQAPVGRYMLETDSPFLAPVPFRGKRCEPAYVQYVAERAAEVRGLSPAILSEQTCGAAESFFRNLS